MKQRVPLQSACKSFEEDLVLYYYGETDEVEQRRVQQHLSQCVSCQGFLDDLRRWLPQIAKSEPMTPAFWDDYYRETVAKLTRQEERKHWWRALFAPRPMWMVPAFGTVGVAVLVVGLLFGKGNLTSFIQRPAERIPQEILADENQLQFFESMDLLESLGKLEKQDDPNTDSTNSQSIRGRLRQDIV
jgi:hypothetical protein